METDKLLDRLKEPWFIELYDLVEQQRIKVDSALKKLSLEEKLPKDDIDRSTAYRIIGKLRKLTKPLD
jgi:hypothetical protein